MPTSMSVRQSAPDRLEICAGGGCLTLFGIPFIAAGVFLILAATQVLPFSNADEVPFWAWPVMLLMGLIFVAVSTSLVFGRTRLMIDRGAGRITKQWRVLVRVKQEEHSLLDYGAVNLSFAAGDSESSDSYDTTLQGASGGRDLALFSLSEYGPALAQAEAVAQFLHLPLVDVTTDHEVVVACGHAGQSLSERLAAGAEPSLDRIKPPPALQSEVQVEGETVRIRIPLPALTRVGLLGYVFPSAIPIFFGPRLLRFLNASDTPSSLRAGVLGFLLLFFVGLPLLAAVSAVVRARRGATIVSASPVGICLEQRGAWRSQTTTIPAAEILSLDHSTSESKARSAERYAARQLGRASPVGSEEPIIGRTGSSPARRRWLGRLIKGQGVVIKSRQGFTSFGSGLSDPEVTYLWALVRRALAGSLASSLNAEDSSWQGECPKGSDTSSRQGRQGRR